ncbi:substrate-binding domain-containing protein [Actinospica sp. MGRD01-02]|uniref:Substrate-binding domain-containing protein n=1 Tax=Actinospica acidithermotolerans TaxID=2828514 RepID=A0A941EKZ4_9ACTN|nr:substrate-binding domain-containing protein [Actinospica acidithermotolerans]MBR7831009.1 substrate-binding domain-containing protein [Actinospica acidithermotolerans]
MTGDRAQDEPGTLGRDLKFQQLAGSLREQIRRQVYVPGARLPTERELAEAGRLSISTVRRAVDELVAEGLVARRQGAGTFVLAPATAETRKRLVGVIVPDAAFYYPRILQGIETVLSGAGARLQLAYSSYSQEAEDRHLEAMLAAGIDGLLIAPTLTGPAPAEEHLARLAALPVPCVLIERRGTSLSDTNEHVCTHHEAGAYEAVRHLTLLGHRMLGLVLRDGSPTTEPVADGFHQAAREFGCTSIEFRALRQEWSPATAERCVARLREAGVSAALCFGDRQAALIEIAARRAGLQVPRDLALVAYDDEVADVADIPLTAVAPPKELLGRIAADLLLRRLEDPALIRHRILLRPSIVVRQSCGAAGPPPSVAQ